MRTPVAEQPFSCAGLQENDISKVQFGNMQIKTFPHKSEEIIDEKVNTFLSEKPIYVLGISQTHITSDQEMLRITYREITKLPGRGV